MKRTLARAHYLATVVVFGLCAVNEFDPDLLSPRAKSIVAVVFAGVMVIFLGRLLAILSSLLLERDRSEKDDGRM